jgi:hypothetical protein
MRHPARLGARGQRQLRAGDQLQRHHRAVEAIALAVQAVAAQHIVQPAFGVQAEGHVDRAALRAGRAGAVPLLTLPVALLEGLGIGMQVDDVGQPGGEEQAAAVVAIGLGAELALGQFQHGLCGVGDLVSGPDGVEDAAAVVADQQLQLLRCLPHRHRDAAAAAVLDGVVQQLGEGVLGQLGHRIGQVEERQEVLRPGRVFMQAGQRIAAHHLPHGTGAVHRPAGRAAALQPLQIDQPLQQAAGRRRADAHALGHPWAQLGGPAQGGLGDPGGGVA